MNIAVRYFSKSGRTKTIAKAIAQGAGAEAVSITEQDSLAEKQDILFIGGAPYANIMAPELRKYIDALSADKVGFAVLFTTSNWSRRTILAAKKTLGSKGIKVADETFFAQASQIDNRIEAAKAFGEDIIKKYGK